MQIVRVDRGTWAITGSGLRHVLVDVTVAALMWRSYATDPGSLPIELARKLSRAWGVFARELVLQLLTLSLFGRAAIVIRFAPSGA